jgi:hypothetical protein
MCNGLAVPLQKSRSRSGNGEDWKAAAMPAAKSNFFFGKLNSETEPLLFVVKTTATAVQLLPLIAGGARDPLPDKRRDGIFPNLWDNMARYSDHTAVQSSTRQLFH